MLQNQAVQVIKTHTMSGRLTEAHMDQLEICIGAGPKKFDLLYAITRDGCDPKIFHQKCDNQGPTVTVLHNPQDSIYGAYSPVSWDTTSGWSSDAKAFLFRLQYNGSFIFNKFPFKGGSYAVYRGSDYGPHFGMSSVNDLQTFTTTIVKTGGSYPLNGHLELNNSYDSQGVSNDQVNNSTMNVTELEVYSVTGMLRLSGYQQ